MLNYFARLVAIPLEVVHMPSSSQLTKEEAGALLRAAREHLGLTQEQVIEQAGIPTITQLSEYENGKVNIARSKYLPKLAALLRLTEEDIRSINPSAVFNATADTGSRRGPPIPPVVPFRETPVEIPDELQRMIDNNSDRYPQLLDPTTQRIIAAPRNFGGPDNGPQTEEEWLEYWITNRRWFTS